MPMAIDLSLGFGAFTPAAGGGLLDGSEADGTQLITGTSEQIGFTSAWATDGSTAITTAAALSPDGTTNAAALTSNATSNDVRRIYSSVQTITANTSYKLSTYGKQNALRYLQVFVQDAAADGACYAIYDLQTGAVTASGVDGNAQSTTETSIEAAVNGFYKCSMRFLLESSKTSIYLLLALTDQSSYVNDFGFANNYSATSGEGVYIWRPKMVV
jgi:hypothetical protein